VRLQELRAGGGREIDLLGARSAAGEETVLEEKGGQHLHKRVPFWSRRQGIRDAAGWNRIAGQGVSLWKAAVSGQKSPDTNKTPAAK
jgi:hypothetical protein